MAEGEGYISVPDGRVWYRIVGSGKGIPLLALHGGPGLPHDYLETLGGLADERPVVFYDQLGCGKSDRPDNPALWRIEHFVEELSGLRSALGLARIHLLGQSWGTVLATEHAFRKPLGVVSLILASPALSIPRFVKDTQEYRSKLPAHTRQVLDRSESAGTTDSEEYQTALGEYYSRHFCRMDPWPDELNRAFAGLGEQVVNTMWGPEEFECTGNLRDYDCTRKLHEINLPMLLTCGRYDTASPGATAWYHSLVANSEMVVFEESGHMAHLEEREKYLAVVQDFLDRVEQAS